MELSADSGNPEKKDGEGCCRYQQRLSARWKMKRRAEQLESGCGIKGEDRISLEVKRQTVLKHRWGVPRGHHRRGGEKESRDAEQQQSYHFRLPRFASKTLPYGVYPRAVLI